MVKVVLVFEEFVHYDIAVIIGNWQAKQIEEGLAWLVKLLLMHNWNKAFTWSHLHFYVLSL